MSAHATSFRFLGCGHAAALAASTEIPTQTNCIQPDRAHQTGDDHPQINNTLPPISDIRDAIDTCESTSQTNIGDPYDTVENIFAAPASACDLLRDIVEDPWAGPLLDEAGDTFLPAFLQGRGTECARAQRR
ncbi:MAG: hypothetical protein AB8B62_09585 [Roseobacter sp.]